MPLLSSAMSNVWEHSDFCFRVLQEYNKNEVRLCSTV